jgi:hypothetical protein
MWESNEPRRDEVRASAPETPRHRARKDRKRWCRGKEGVEHTPVLRYTKWGQYRQTRDPQYVMCGWTKHWRSNRPGSRRELWSWHCSHERGCSTCGKILDARLGHLCPEYTPDHVDAFDR